MALEIQKWLMAYGLNANLTMILAKLLGFLLIVVLAWISYKLTRQVILPKIIQLVARTRSSWDDTLMGHGFFNQAARLCPVIVVYLVVPMIFEHSSSEVFYIQKAMLIYAMVLAVFIADTLLNTFHDIYNTYALSDKVPIKSFIQVSKLGCYLICGIFIISLLFNKTPIYLISGLGAMTAVIMLIFKDAILGFIAGIQLTANKMVAVGDWIEMPKFGADGDVVELGLTTVKVQNFDKTLTMIPTYALISDSFKNWHGMSVSGGRRVKRAIYLDMNSIKFCEPELINRLEKVQCLSEYINSKRLELEEYNKTIDESHKINTRRLTNVGSLRAYLLYYLKSHPYINQDMTLLVRQLKPTEYGLPIEIYAFCNDTDWAIYEAVQADIFDHILAVVPEFDLKIFQSPTGSDFQAGFNPQSDR